MKWVFAGIRRHLRVHFIFVPGTVSFFASALTTPGHRVPFFSGAAVVLSFALLEVLRTVHLRRSRRRMTFRDGDLTLRPSRLRDGPAVERLVTAEVCKSYGWTDKTSKSVLRWLRVGALRHSIIAIGNRVDGFICYKEQKDVGLMHIQMFVLSKSFESDMQERILRLFVRGSHSVGIVPSIGLINPTFGNLWERCGFTAEGEEVIENFEGTKDACTRYTARPSGAPVLRPTGIGFPRGLRPDTTRRHAEENASPPHTPEQRHDSTTTRSTNGIGNKRDDDALPGMTGGHRVDAPSDTDLGHGVDPCRETCGGIETVTVQRPQGALLKDPRHFTHSPATVPRPVTKRSGAAPVWRTPPCKGLRTLKVKCQQCLH